MPLFMTLSGYVYYTAYFNEAGESDGPRIYRQASNLTVVYFIFGIPMGVVKVFAGNLANESTSLMDVALIPIKPLAPYWYLYVLIILYLFFSLPRMSMLSQRVVGTAVIVASIYGSVVSIEWLSLSRTLYYSLFFYLGFAHRKYSKSVIGNGKLAMLSFAVSVLLMVLLWNDKKVINSYQGICIIAALGPVLVVWYLFENVPFFGNSRFLRACGRYSLEIYVIHHTLAAGFRVILLRVGIDSAFISAVLNMFLSTSIPVLFSLACKKLKIHGIIFCPVSYFKKSKAENY